MMLLGAYLLLNAIGFLLMGEDKRRAKKHRYRIQERSLWLVALIGGAVGTTAGMQVFRHKTKHTSFRIGFPLLAVVEFVGFVYLLLK